MREMKDSGVAWIGEIPEEWEISLINTLYTVRNTKVSDVDYQPLSVTMKGIVPQLSTAAKTNAHDDRKLVKKGDFAINSRSDRRGSCGISDYDGSVSLINTVLSPRNEMNPIYYSWLFHSSEFADEFYRWGHGIVDDLWTTRWQEMRNISIPVPPLSIQHQIAAYLDQKCTQIDALIANQQKQIEKLKAYKQSLITETVTKGLNPDVPMKDSGVEWIGEIPKDFSVQNIRSLFTIKKDIIGHEPDTVLSITRSGIKIKDISENNGQMADSYANYQIVNIGDFAMNHMDLLTGGIGISQYNGVTSPDYRVFNLKDNKMNPRYFLYIFETYYRNKIFYAFGQGAANLGRWRLPAKNFYSIYIPVAPIEEQQAIVSYLDQKCTQIDNLIAIKQKKIEKLQQYKKSLIYEYVTGKKEI